MKKVFTILASYNSSQYIDQCLNSLLNSEYPTEIVVIDNHSTDNSLSILEHYGDSIILFQEQQNLGFGIANNKGIIHAMENHADYIFLMNMDARIPPDTLGKLVSAAEEHPEYGIISPTHMNFENKVEEVFLQRTLSKSGGLDFISALYLQKPLKDIYEAEFIAASAWLLPVPILRKTGGFSSLFYPAYGEDNDLIFRMKLHGYKTGFVPQALFYHDTGRARKTLFDRPCHRECVLLYLRALDPDKSFFHMYTKEVLLLPLRILAYSALDPRKAKELFFVLRTLLKKRRKLLDERGKNQKKETIGFACEAAKEDIPAYLKQ